MNEDTTQKLPIISVLVLCPYCMIRSQLGPYDDCPLCAGGGVIEYNIDDVEFVRLDKK